MRLEEAAQLRASSHPGTSDGDPGKPLELSPQRQVMMNANAPRDPDAVHAAQKKRVTKKKPPVAPSIRVTRSMSATAGGLDHVDLN